MQEMEQSLIKDPDDAAMSMGFPEHVSSPKIVPSGVKDVLTINTETEIVEHDATTIQ